MSVYPPLVQSPLFREFKDVVFEDVVFDNNRFDMDVAIQNNIQQGHATIIIKHHILKHHILELPIYSSYIVFNIIYIYIYIHILASISYWTIC